MRYGFQRPFVAALLSSLMLAACGGGTQNAILPGTADQQVQGRHVMGLPTITHVTSGGTNASNSGICSGVGLDCKNSPIIGEPGPLPGENAPDPGDLLASGADCSGAKATNTTAVPGSSNHGDMIAGAYMLSSVGAGNTSQDVAFEYVTYGGQEYVQFFVTGSVSGGAGIFSLGLSGTHSPMVPWNSNAYTALELAAKAAGLAVSALPYPLNQINPNVRLTQTKCNKKTIVTG